MKKLCFDLEANNLLNEETVDYTQAPYKLKHNFKLHCAAAMDVDTGQVWEFVGAEEIKNGLIPLMDEYDVLIAHNGINYDFLVLKMYFGCDYSIRDEVDGWDMFNGKPKKIVDTLVLSKVLNPDRPGHSVDYFGKLFKLEKIDWRAEAVALGLIQSNARKGAEFETYHPAMLTYNIRDVELNVRIFKYLMAEWGTWDWRAAFVLESQVAEIITRQSHRGFKFFEEKAKAAVRDLDIRMEDHRAVVEPELPKKKPTQAEAKEYCPPKIQLKKTDGSVTAIMYKWIAKHGGEVFEATDDLPAHVIVFGKKHRLPMPCDSLLQEVPAKISDTTHIKGWLVEMGWIPTSWKERDLSVDTKKQKLSEEKYAATVERYVQATLDSPFCKFRCEKLGIRPMKSREALAHALRSKLMNTEQKAPKVYTNPQITVGVEKELCPNLEEIMERFPHAKRVTEYLTYRHRRNSILGGGFDPDEDDEPEKGYLAALREDGRIPTPADTCGAGTSRFKHRLVANIPRVTSVYGKELRDLFGVDNGFIQLGYDFDSLEAKVEAHFCIAEAMRSLNKNKLALAIEYGNTLTAEKPNDVHTVTAAKVSQMIGQTFSRGSAKNVKYGASYGAQPARIAAIVGCEIELAEQIFNAFWTAAKPLKDFKDALTRWWKEEGNKKFILGIDGRKIPTRSAHALVNSAFQSTGVICAKKAMVLHDRKMKAEGLSVDFFTDTFTDMNFCQQLIAYHDEAQLEVSRALVKFKVFPIMGDDDEAKDAAKALATAYKEERLSKDGQVWSDVQKSTKGFYVAYTRAGELAIEAVEEAGRYFNLNVDLTAGYMTGTSWASCH